MAILTSQQQADLQSAIDLLTKGQAYETPLSEDVTQRIAKLASDAGGVSSGRIYEAARDNPKSLLIALVLESGFSILTQTEQDQLFAAMNLMLAGQAYETPFAEDVIERLAPVAVSTGFLTKGGLYEAIRDNPVSTMLKWALFLGTK